MSSETTGMADPSKPPLTERRRFDDHQSRFLGAIVESSEDAIVSKTLDGIITSWNAAAQRLFGYPPEEIIGQEISVLMPPERRQEDMNAILGRVRRGERVEHYETVRIAKDGRRIPVSLSVSPIKDAAGRVIGAAKIARDITDRKQAEEERERLLRETQQALQIRDTFLSVAGHEFRTPLNALQLQLYNLELMLKDPGYARAVERARREVERLGLLTRQLLDVARMASGGFTLERAPTDLAELTREVVTRMRDDARRLGSEIALSADGPVIGNWDRLRLDQVVTNLVANAIKFGRGRPVEVSVERERALARVVVRDHGIGVPESDRERIFQRFERAVSERSFGGLGLGLWIAQQVVSAHGGRIGVESRPGEGAKFYFELGYGHDGEEAT